MSTQKKSRTKTAKRSAAPARRGRPEGRLAAIVRQADRMLHVPIDSIERGVSQVEMLARRSVARALRQTASLITRAERAIVPPTPSKAQRRASGKRSQAASGRKRTAVSDIAA